MNRLAPGVLATCILARCQIMHRDCGYWFGVGVFTTRYSKIQMSIERRLSSEEAYRTHIRHISDAYGQQIIKISCTGSRGVSYAYQTHIRRISNPKYTFLTNVFRISVDLEQNPYNCVSHLGGYQINGFRISVSLKQIPFARTIFFKITRVSLKVNAGKSCWFTHSTSPRAPAAVLGT